MPRFKSLLCTCGLLCLCSQKQTALSYKGKSSCYLVTGDTQKQNGRILAPGNYTGCFICCMQLRNSGALISPALVGGSTSTSSQRNCNTNGPQKGNASTPKKCMACMYVFLRHLEQLTSHHVKDHRPWFVATQTKKQETERLQVPLPPCGWRVSMHRGLKGLFGVNTTTWKGLSGCHLSD